MTGRFGEYARGRRLAEFGAGVGVAALRGQDVVQVRHGSAPALIAVGEADRADALLLACVLWSLQNAGGHGKRGRVLVPAP